MVSSDGSAASYCSLKRTSCVESVFPVESQSAPTRHHVVLYYRAVLSAFPPELRCEPREVDAWCWMDGARLGRGFLDGKPCVSEEDMFDYEEVPSRRRSSSKMLQLQGLPDTHGRYGADRLSTGTKFVLKLRFGH